MPSALPAGRIRGTGDAVMHALASCVVYLGIRFSWSLARSGNGNPLDAARSGTAHVRDLQPAAARAPPERRVQTLPSALGDGGEWA